MAGYNGILWDFMGNGWESADFRGFRRFARDFQKPGFLLAALWISL